MIRGDQPFGTKALGSATLLQAFKAALAGQHKALAEITQEAELPSRISVRDAESAWLAIALLATEAELPIRLVTVEALAAFSAHAASAEALMQHATEWLEAEDDREFRFGAAATVITVLSNGRVLAALRDHEAVLQYVSRVIGLISDAPRSAERSDARRRILRALPTTLLAIMGRMARISTERAAEWLGRECELASQPQLREALSEVIVSLGKDTQGLGRGTIDTLRKTLVASAAPLRDGTVKRPGTGRGKSSRKIR